MEPEDDQFKIKQEAKTHAVYALILDTSKLEGVGYSDLAGPFPYTSARGYRYIFFFYSWDANAILMEPMKNRGDTKMKRVHEKTYNRLEARGIKPTMNILDNEASSLICTYLTNSKVQYQKYHHIATEPMPQREQL